MDNYYNSVGLSEFLLRNGMNVTGTLRAKRKGNPAVVTTKFQKGGTRSIKYNQFMSVDRQNQMLAYYTCEHKTMRWYKIVGIHILQMMMLNVYCLYQTKSKKKMLCV